MIVPTKAVPGREPGRTLAACGLAVVAAWLTTADPVRAGDVTFLFRPEGPAQTVTVAGTFNDWNHQANALADADGDGVWEATLPVPAGRQAYKFVVNGTDWFEDPHAAEFEADGFGGKNSVMEVGDAPVTVGNPGPGAPPAVDTRSEITFRFTTSGRTVNAVSVAGSFNEWDAGAHPRAGPDGNGVWQRTLRLEPGRYAYQFVIDGGEWRSCDVSVPHEADGFGGRRALLDVTEEPVTVADGLR